MSIHDQGINYPMSFEAATREWVSVLEDHEAEETGLPIAVARRSLSRKLRIAPGTLENIRRGRPKGIGRLTAERLQAFMLHHPSAKVQAFIIRHLESEIRRHAHDLELVYRRRENSREAEILEARAVLAKARAVLDGALK